MRYLKIKLTVNFPVFLLVCYYHSFILLAHSFEIYFSFSSSKISNIARIIFRLLFRSLIPPSSNPVNKLDPSICDLFSFSPSFILAKLLILIFQSTLFFIQIVLISSLLCYLTFQSHPTNQNILKQKYFFISYPPIRWVQRLGILTFLHNLSTTTLSFF